MVIRKSAALLAASMLVWSGVTVQAASAAPPSVREASIPFVSMGSINDWRADGSRGLYVQDQQRRWYYARLMGPCTDLPFANAIGFETRGPNRLDRFSTVIVRGQRCVFQSFVASAGPPAKAKKPHKG